MPAGGRRARGRRGRRCRRWRTWIWAARVRGSRPFVTAQAGLQQPLSFIHRISAGAGMHGEDVGVCFHFRFRFQTADAMRQGERRQAPSPLLFGRPGVSPRPFFRLPIEGEAPRQEHGGWSAGRAPGAGEAPLGGIDAPARAPGEGARPPDYEAGCALPALHRRAGAVRARPDPRRALSARRPSDRAAGVLETTPAA